MHGTRGCLCSRGLVCSGCSVWVRGKVHYMWVRYVGSLVPSAQPYSHPSPLSMVLMTHLATSLISAPPAAHDWGCAACDVHVMCLRRTPAPPAIPVPCDLGLCIMPDVPSPATCSTSSIHTPAAPVASCGVVLCTLSSVPDAPGTKVWGPVHHGMGACAPWPLCPVPPAPNTPDIQGGMEGVEGTGGHGGHRGA